MTDEAHYPEPGAVLDGVTHAAIFLVLTISPGGESTVRDVLADSGGLLRSVGFRSPENNLSLVIGIGSDAWDRLYAGPRPADLHEFIALDGPVHHAPSTPGDLLLHIRAERLDLCFELATLFMDRLGGVAEVVDEVHGFRYFDLRDLLGFVDGTENPTGRAKFDAVVIGDEDPTFAGGSYVIVQKYLHDMSAWNALTVEQQEAAIGRTKLADVELPDDVKPVNSHVALNTVNDADGNQLQILRDNMPFGAVGTAEYGTYFIGYARTPAVTEQMLRNMFLGNPPGTTDRILDFSTAVTGVLFYTPPPTFFDAQPAAADSAAAQDITSQDPDDSAPTADASLGIGSLKRSTP
ncbi:Dyp-type peroxidase [Millisia brevis]|uniref:Dyp-type peroxidase n=1 Tax=Millisia brevis TaxID=264148 RepID=UPI00082FAC4C|nr:Dyp-type peroxidase [Millisia brevis]